MINKLHALLALGQAATMLRRPDVAAAVTKVVHAFTGDVESEDHDFHGAPRTKAWVESHGQPAFSRHADYINELTRWACELERMKKKEE